MGSGTGQRGWSEAECWVCWCGALVVLRPVLVEKWYLMSELKVRKCCSKGDVVRRVWKFARCGEREVRITVNRHTICDLCLAILQR